MSTFRRLLHRLRLRPSLSITLADGGQAFASGMKRGIDETEARRAELLASGLTPEEASTVMWREMLADPGFPVFLAHAERMARRSFWTLYEDDGEPGASAD